MRYFNIGDINWKNLSIRESNIIDILEDLIKKFGATYVFDNDCRTKLIYFYSNYEKLLVFLDALAEVSKEPSKKWSEMKTAQKSVTIKDKNSNRIFLNSNKSLLFIPPPDYPKFQYFANFAQKLNKLDVIMAFSYLQFIIEKFQVIIWLKNNCLTCVSDIQRDYMLACQYIRSFCFCLSHEHTYRDDFMFNFSAFNTEIDAENIIISGYENEKLVQKNVQRLTSNSYESRLIRTLSQEGRKEFKSIVDYMQSMLSQLIFWKGEINLTLSIGHLYFQGLTFKSKIDASRLDHILKNSEYAACFSGNLISSIYNTAEILSNLRSKIEFSDINIKEYMLLCCSFHFSGDTLEFNVKFNIENDETSKISTIENAKSAIFSRTCQNICQPMDVQIKMLTRANSTPLEYDECIQQFIKTIKPVNSHKFIWAISPFIKVRELKKVKSVAINTNIARIELNQTIASHQVLDQQSSKNLSLLFQTIQLQSEAEYLSINLHATSIEHFFKLPIKTRRQAQNEIPNLINSKFFSRFINLAADVIDCI